MKNTWGKSWGDEGYFKVLRGIGHCGVGSFWMQPVCKVPYHYPKPTYHQPVPTYHHPVPVPTYPVPTYSKPTYSKPAYQVLTYPPSAYTFDWSQ